MMDEVKSINEVTIRLTMERWIHITEGHPELINYYFNVLDTIKEPEAIYAGNSGEQIAIKNIKNEKYMIVIYKEYKKDGFVITAFLTKRKKQIKKRRRLWGTLK